MLVAVSATAFGQTPPQQKATSDAACRTWQWVNPRPESRDLTAVVAGDPGVVAVGDMGTILFSPEGISWRVVSSGTTEYLSDVLWTGERFVAVGDAGTVVTSADGVFWTLMMTDTDLDLVQVAFGDGMLVAVGPDASVLASSDGISWTVTEFCDPEWCSASVDDVVWTGTLFVVAGTETSAVSPDGLQWEVSYLSYWDERSTPRALAWNGAEVLLLDEYQGSIDIWKSNDGLSWDWPGDPNWLYATNIAWLDGTLFAVGDRYWTYTTTDLSSWVWEPLPPKAMNLRSITWTGERFVAVGKASEIVTSRSGFNWKVAQIADGPLGQFRGLSGGSGTLVAVSDHGDIGVSTDGFEWSAAPDDFWLYDVAFGNGRFVAVTGSSSAVSLNGQTWNLFPTGTQALRAVEWVGDRFLTAGTWPREIIGSTDGESWNVEYSGSETSSNRYFGLAAGNGRVVAAGINDDYPSKPVVLIERSPGTWDETFPFAGTELKGSLRDVAYGGGHWVVVGYYGKIATSTDLETWLIIDPDGTNFFFSVSWNGSEFLATGWNGAVFSSPDGLVWTRETTPTQVTLFSSEWFDGDWYAAGEGGAVLRGSCTWTTDAPVAGFSFEPSDPAPGEIVHFSDTSTGYATSWSWLFGGGYSSAVSPTHVYPSPGSYNVMQTVCNGTACDTATGTVTVVEKPPEAAFSWRLASLMADEPATWLDLSIGPPTSWSWVFGDGAASTDQEPVHAYAESGIYTARFEVSNPSGRDRVDAQVVVGPAPVVATGSARDIVWTGSNWLAVENEGVLLSTDGSEWTEHPFGNDYSLSAVAWTGERYVAAGGGYDHEYYGLIGTSEDGTSWSFELIGSEWLNDVASCDGTTVVVGDDGKVLVSSDLVAWQEATSGTTDDVHRVACGDGLFVATVRGSPGIIESSDGLSWVAAAFDDHPANAVIWAIGHFYADTSYSGEHVVMRQPDGSWVLAAGELPVFGDPDDLAVVDGQLLASIGNSAYEKSALLWFSPELSLWVPIADSAGGRMALGDNTLMILENGNIRRLDVQPDRLLADGFESGDLSAWSGSSE